MGFKIFLGGNKDVGAGIQAQELRRPLLGQVVRHNKNRLLAQPQPLAFHCGRNHFKRLSGTHFVRQQRIATVKHMGDCIFLMLPQLDFRVHAGKNNMAPVILAGAGAVHFLVVLPA